MCSLEDTETLGSREDGMYWGLGSISAIQFSILDKEFLSFDDELLSVKDGEVGWNIFNGFTFT